MTTIKNLKRFGVFAFAVVLLGSCTSSAHIEKDPSTDLANYRTYSWIDNNTGEKKDHKNDLVEANIRTAVDQQLDKNGYRQVKNNPDLLLTYDILLEKNERRNSQPVYSQPYTRLYYNRYTRRYGTIYYPSQVVGYDTYTTPVKEGTVTVTMIDPKTDKTIWQGWATDQINSSQMTGKEIQKNVKTIFKKFDVASN